ncbi:hypothetical protein Cni_G15888 [Canna indica]|uniref:Uncharacterized protein n=1 Tax=Canna indica TaxID=4628 RepID=A0AAQ3KEM1_9LILI|nr:hypothetical protein Cni_G15888 [Canna indica]
MVEDRHIEIGLPVSSLQPPKPVDEDEQAVNRIYYIAAADIDRMKAATKKRTKVEAFIAYIWRVLAKTTTLEEKWCRMGVVVDDRSRLGSANEEPLIISYCIHCRCS